MDIRCRKTNCKYNKDLTCMSQKITINKKLECIEFKKEIGKGLKDFSKLIFSENPPKVADYRHIKDLCLTCQAKCIFNQHNHCIANGITVNAACSPEPKCMTFMKP